MARQWLARFDDRVDRGFDPLRTNALANRIFYTASELGDWSLLWHVCGTAQGLREHPGPLAAVRLSSALGIESALVNGAIKNVVRRERPVFTGGDRPHLLRQPKTSSFPSGHASSGFMAASLLARQAPRARAAYFVAAAVVAASRVHVRIHHASDVVAGAALGLGLARLTERVWPSTR